MTRENTGILVLLLAFLSGCASTHRVDSGQPDQWIMSAREQLLGNHVDVETTGGVEVYGILHDLTADSLSVWEDETDLLVGMELTEVSYLGRPRSPGGPIIGAIGGLLFGAVVGGEIGSSTSENESFRGLDRLSGGMTGAMLGAMAGGAFGGYITRSDQYRIRHTGPADNGMKK